MAIFSKPSTKSAKTIECPSTANLKISLRVRRRLLRGSTVLSGIKVAAAVAGKVGGSVPYMQGIVDAANEVVACAEAMKNNRKECKKIAALTEELVKGVLAETDGVEEDELSERSRLNLAELEWKLETVGKAMKEMRKMTLLRRLLSKDEHATQLVEHRRTLQDAVVKFQLMHCVRMDLRMARIEKKQDVVVEALIFGQGGSSTAMERSDSGGVAVRGSGTRVSIEESYFFLPRPRGIQFICRRGNFVRRTVTIGGDGEPRF
ncbi:hypothetical protein GSI_01446 [Ganoderma sinense ZZ0214-1]|uniref:Uncharacterized protein n=1 Tax=Ganoderma sinense ZZ0214-1 TaxID=1077348 RepID=A0A2G8SVJ1_9APHY|nr:hypothetical protein GSI_01446 [Ganoderma sinense ZZ0214-1]